MSFFTNFPTIRYKFGNEVKFNALQDLSAYIDIIDQVKDNVNFYQKYTIMDGERADILSYKIYGTTQYYWTFYLLNDNLRQQGWPLSYQQLITRAKTDYPNTVVVTRDNISNRFKIGDTIKGQISGSEGTIIKRNLDLGQIFVKGSKTFVSGETAVSGSEVIQLQSSSTEYDATHHYINSDGEVVDIDPFNGPGVSVTPVTYYERYVEANDELKQIKVIKPSNIRQIVDAYNESLRQI